VKPTEDSKDELDFDKQVKTFAEDYETAVHFFVLATRAYRYMAMAVPTIPG
jgi:hypothetical protein